MIFGLTVGKLGAAGVVTGAAAVSVGTYFWGRRNGRKPVVAAPAAAPPAPASTVPAVHVHMNQPSNNQVAPQNPPAGPPAGGPPAQQ